MPITEDDPSFLYEAWSLYAFGTLLLFARWGVRLRTVGFRGLQADDFFSILVIIFYAMDAWTVHLIYFLGTNVEASVIQQSQDLSPSELHDFSLGSKLEITAWYSYATLLWTLKGTMLSFFARMTIGTWHKHLVNYVSIACAISYAVVMLTITFSCWPFHMNYQVSPTPPAKCTLKMQNFLVTTVLNVLSDGAIWAIPLPLLWRLRVPLRKKLVIGILLSSGLFVITAAIIRCVLTLSSSPSALTINRWGVRETIVGIITVNIPVLRPLFGRAFWINHPVSYESSHRTGKSSGRFSSGWSGPYEMSTNATVTGPGHLSRDLESNNGSQDCIVNKEEAPNVVMVQTTYQVTSDLGTTSANGIYSDSGGITESSVQAGAQAQH